MNKETTNHNNAKTKQQMRMAMDKLVADNEALLDRTIELEEQVRTLNSMLADRYHRHVGDLPGESLRIDSVERDPQGRVKVQPDLPTYEERMKARKEVREHEIAEQKATRAEGLEQGFWRDPTGLIRNQSGAPVGRALAENDARKRTDAAIAKEHGEFLEAHGISRRQRAQDAAKAERNAEQARLRDRKFTEKPQDDHSEVTSGYDPLDAIVD